MKIICPVCRKEWERGSEQAAAIALYDMCIVCCVRQEEESDFLWSIEDVLAEQKTVRQHD